MSDKLFRDDDEEFFRPDSPPSGKISRNMRRTRAVRNMRNTVFIATFCFILIALLIVSVFFMLFRVRSVVLENCTVYNADDIIAKSGIAYGSHIYSIDKGLIESNILEQFPLIKDVRVLRGLPGTLRLVLEEDYPVFSYHAGDGVYYIMSDELRFLSITDQTGAGNYIPISLPELKEPVIGESPEFENDRILNGFLTVIPMIMDSGFAPGITSIDFSERFNMSLLYNNQFRIVFGNSDLFEEKIRATVKIAAYLDERYAYASGTVYVIDPEDAVFKFDSVS